jgi:ubiquinone/menaquinone biosynthesis C-methylase UbiE
MSRSLGNTASSFNRDVSSNEGYLYTTHASLSSRIANRRLTDATLEAVDLRGKRVLDIGCGDGTYTLELFDRGRPASMQGVDAAEEAIKVALRKAGSRRIDFCVESACRLPYADNSFDIACIRGVLHHVEHPVDALREAFRVAPVIVVIEPNGYNPFLKLLERFSNYHIAHKERSFTSKQFDHWVSRQGGVVEKRKWLGLVPFFSPDWIARVLKFFEPAVERVPPFNFLLCAVYVFVAQRKEK